MKRVASKAWDLTDAQLATGHWADQVTSRDELAIWLKDEVESAYFARPRNIESDIKYRWTYYEQGRTRGVREPWPNAADLTSPYCTEFVDAILGRLMDAIRGEPMWIVEGWGESAKRAPFVEEFHQRTAEQERLPDVLHEVLLRALIEPCGILEISEPTQTIRTRKTIQAKLRVDDQGSPVLGPDGPQLDMDEYGNPVEVDASASPGPDGQLAPPVPSAEAVVDVDEAVRVGPAYDVVPYLDYVRLPSHARKTSEIWGYAKRFYRRVSELKATAAKGIYDRDAVDYLGTADERLLRNDQSAVWSDQTGPLAQKELWEVPFLADLDGKGDRWWLATLSLEHCKLLRLVVDDRTSRFIEFTTSRKPASRDGYSLVEKMMTILEEDTAVRNMRADKAALAIAAPIKRQVGALWDPFEQPFGPGGVIDVRDMNEVQQMVLSDVPASINVWKMDIRSDLERLIGMNDVSVGTQTEERRTLGEVQLAAGYSEVRVRGMLSCVQEGLEELAQVRHEIWKRTLQQQSRGLPIPNSMMQSLDARGMNVASITSNGRITADMLEGQFWFKARGSVEVANLDRQAAYFTGLLATLANMAKVNPTVGVLLSSPAAAMAMVKQALRVARWPDRGAFLGAEAQAAVQQHQEQQAMQQQMAAIQGHPAFQALLHMAGGGGAPAGGPMPESGGTPAPPQLPMAG